MSFKRLKNRIKKNEGFSIKPYKDQLGYFTIGYGHLIRENEKKYFLTKFKKKYFEKLFEIDFKNSVDNYNKYFKEKHHNQSDKELIIEMIFQLGSNGVSKFIKMLKHINSKQKYMTCLEMMDSLWYKQTPKRVENLIKNFTK